MAATANASGVGMCKVEPMDEAEINDYYKTPAEVKEETEEHKFHLNSSELAQQQGLNEDMSTGEHPFEGRT